MQKETRLNAHSERPLDILVLAAGLGTRMKSGKAKVLHQLGGRPLIAHVCRTAESLEPRKIHVIVGHQADKVEAAVLEELDPSHVTFIKQAQQLGTGDAVMSARQALHAADSTVLILSGDVPLIRAETLRLFMDHHRQKNSVCTMLSVRMENPTGYGRIVRDDQDRFLKIVEQKDATPEEKQIREINSGIYCFETSKLFSSPGTRSTQEPAGRVLPDRRSRDPSLRRRAGQCASAQRRPRSFRCQYAGGTRGIRKPAAAQYDSRPDAGGRRNVYRSFALLHKCRSARLGATRSSIPTCKLKGRP